MSTTEVFSDEELFCATFAKRRNLKMVEFDLWDMQFISCYFFEFRFFSNPLLHVTRASLSGFLVFFVPLRFLLCLFRCFRVLYVHDFSPPSRFVGLQHHAERLRMTESPVQHMKRLFEGVKDVGELELRRQLGEHSNNLRLHQMGLTR